MTWESAESQGWGCGGTSRPGVVTPELRAQTQDQPGESIDNGKKMGLQISGGKAAWEHRNP